MPTPALNALWRIGGHMQRLEAVPLRTLRPPAKTKEREGGRSAKEHRAPRRKMERGEPMRQKQRGGGKKLKNFR